MPKPVPTLTPDRGKALSLLEAAYDARREAPLRLAEAGHKVLAHLGADAPRELFLAAGFTPVRLCGEPGAPSPLGDDLLGPAADGETRSQLQLLLDGRYGPLERLVIAHDTEALVRIFYTLRALRKLQPERAAKAPAPYFFDLLHMPHRTTGLYNRTRARELAAQLEAWGGVQIDDAALRRGIGLVNAGAALLQGVQAARADAAPRLTGLQALKVMACRYFIPPEEYAALLRRLLQEVDGVAAKARPRVLVTGSGQDNAELYACIETAGGQVVGEDFDWGLRGAEILTETTARDPLDAIVDRYHFAPPAAAKSSVAHRARYTAAMARACGADAVVCFIRDGDPAPRWDVPAQREALGGTPMLLLDDQPYGLGDPDALTDQIAGFLKQARV